MRLCGKPVKKSTMRSSADSGITKMNRPPSTISHPITSITSGQPVAGADVRWSRPEARGTAVAVARRTSDGQGRFVFEGVAAGALVLEARSERHAPARLELQVDPQEPPEGLEMMLEKGASLAGRVIDPQGVPIRGASIMASSEGADPLRRQVDSATDGSFLLQGLTTGPWTVRATRELVDEERRIDLAPGVHVELELVLGADGEPLEGAVVTERGEVVAGVLLRLEPLDDGRAVRTVVDELGRFRFPAVLGGTYQLRTGFSGERADVPVALAEDPGPITLDGDPETPEPTLEIRVGSGTVLRGRVLGLEQDMGGAVGEGSL